MPKGKRLRRNYKHDISKMNLFMCVIEDGTLIWKLTTGTNNQITLTSWISI